MEVGGQGHRGPCIPIMDWRSGAWDAMRRALQHHRQGRPRQQKSGGGGRLGVTGTRLHLHLLHPARPAPTPVQAWLPPWGFTGLTPTQKANRKKNLKQEHAVLAALRAAAAAEPAQAATGGTPPAERQ